MPTLALIDWWQALGRPLIDTLVIGACAVGLMVLALWVVDKITPYSLGVELQEKQNLAVAIVMGAFVLGVAIVVASVAAG